MSLSTPRKCSGSARAIHFAAIQWKTGAEQRPDGCAAGRREQDPDSDSRSRTGHGQICSDENISSGKLGPTAQRAY
eukprot:7888461-Pyramimonas_sp.AAC.1